MNAPPAFRARRGAARFGHVLILAAFVAFLAFPFYWMVLTTFKETKDLIDVHHNPFLFNLPPTLENLRILFGDTLFGTWIVNTLEVGVLVTIITLALAVPAGYALARLTGRWSQRLAIGCPACRWRKPTPTKPCRSSARPTARLSAPPASRA